MSGTNQCPVNGCDYGEDESKSLAALRSHINARGDDAHDWQELKPEVTGEEPEEPEEPEENEETEENEENEENEESDENEEEEMPTDEEYQQQYQQDGDGDGDGDGGSSDGDGGSSFSIPALDGSTVMLLLGVVAVLVILYMLMNRDGDAVEHAESVEEDTEDSGGDALTEEEVTLLE